MTQSGHIAAEEMAPAGMRPRPRSQRRTPQHHLACRPSAPLAAVTPSIARPAHEPRVLVFCVQIARYEPNSPKPVTAIASSLRFTSAALSQTYTGWLIVMSVVGHAPTPGESIMATI